jgi:hypothetical protein
MPPRTRTPAPAAPTDPASAPSGAESAPPPDPGGWFRNTGASELTVLGEGVTAVLAPGRIAALMRTPTHRDLEAATEAQYRAQQATALAAAEAVPEPAPTTDGTEA